MGHVCQEVALCIISTLGADLLFHELALCSDIWSYRKKRKNGTYEKRYEKNNDITYYRGTCLGRELVLEPVNGKVNRHDPCDISLVVENRAVSTIELAPLVCIRRLIHRSLALACNGERSSIFDWITVACGAHLVKIHRENECIRGRFLNAVNIFKFNIISEYRKGIVYLVIIFASDSLLGQGLHHLAAD